MPERPPHGWAEIPEGGTPTAEPDPNWVPLPPGQPCMTKAPWGAVCGKPAIVAWQGEAKCARHSHGHWVEDGHAMHWVMRYNGSKEAAPVE
jgi:hypothetical protein